MRKIDISNIILESKRLLIRGWKITDLDDFYEYAKVPGVGEMAGWTHHQSKEESMMILKMFIDGKHTFAVISKDDNKVIGSIGIEESSVAIENKEGKSIGCVLNKNYWGKGIMVEALTEVINYLFTTLKLDYLIYSYFVWNKQSKRVMEKLGFEFLRVGYFKSTVLDNRNSYDDFDCNNNIYKIEETNINILYNKHFI